MTPHWPWPLVKVFSLRLRLLVQKALEFQAVVAENNELRLRLQSRTDTGLLLG